MMMMTLRMTMVRHSAPNTANKGVHCDAESGGSRIASS